MQAFNRLLPAWSVFLLAGQLFAQATRPAETPSPPTQPAQQQASALVADVQGTATYAVAQADGAYGPKQPIKKGDRLSSGTRIQTLYRSFVILTFGNDTVVKIDPLTLASVDQFLQSADAKSVQLGLGHGMVRGGSAAPTLRSELSIVTPTATLTKRGTHEFGLRYEPSTGRYRAYLTQTGLIEVLNRSTGVRRMVEPTQYVTQAMVRWIQTAVFDREVAVHDLFGLTPNEQSFAARQSFSGVGIVEPGGGNAGGIMAGRDAGGTTGGGAFRPISPPILPPQQQGVRVLDRPEGNFGARR